jgi:hypothetical protein
MIASRPSFWVAAIVIVAVCAGAGYLLGNSNAASKSDAARERRESFNASLASTQAQAERSSHAKGLKQGLVSGHKAGKEAGASDGSSAADAQLTQIAEAQNGGCPAGEVPVQILGGPPCSPTNPPGGCIPGTGPGQPNPQCEAPPGSPAYHGPGGAY